jgi:adenylate kinase
MYKYIISGIQGSGKGTQAQLLVDAYDFVHLSIGDMLRWHVQHHTKIGTRVQKDINLGVQIDDNLINQMLDEHLNQHDWSYGFILDGYPRNTQQAERLIRSYNIDAFINLEISEEIVRERILRRRVCKQCLQGQIANGDGKEVCVYCGGELIARKDDNPEAVDKRLKDYHTLTEPILTLFNNAGLLLNIDASKNEQDVHSEICEKLNLPMPAKALKLI